VVIKLPPVYNTNTTNNFDKQARKLAKRYISIMADIDALRLSLAQNPFQGDGLGNDLYKVRMAIKSKGKGKSGGARVITMVKIIHRTVTLAAIYDKSDMETISGKELKDLL
jgi:hypothetical protein